MPYCQPITDEQLASFLEAVKLLTIPADEVKPLEVKAIPEPSTSQNETILAMHQALIAEAIKMNAKNAKEYEERKKMWYLETAIAAYLNMKRKAEEAEAKRKAEEAAAKKAAEEENEHTMDANSEGEDEVNKDETPKLKLRLKKMKSRLIVDLESEEETEEVKAKRRKEKGKGKVVDPEYKQNTVPVDYAGCPGVPVRKMCEGYDEADFIMLEAADNEELQAKLKKLCDEQDTFKAQKEKEKAERNKLLGNSTKAGTITVAVTGTKKKVQVNAKASGSNAKASGSTPKGSKRKVVSEEGDIEVMSRLKRVRTVASSHGSNERIPSVAESLHGINKALIEIVDLLEDTRAANKHQAKYLRGIETCMANIQNAMQTHVGQVHYCLGELERGAGIWPVEDKEFADEEFEPAGLENMEEEVEEVHKEDKEGHEVEDDDVRGRLQISARNLSVRNYPSCQAPSGSDSARDSPSTHSSTPMAGEWEVWLETMVTWWRIYAHIVIAHE
ncbi:hypothetical protein M422DRAFT_274772 [Sphaerobolus stellatus SS14]|uniref:Unplaced genomic scaffold SPHSTscaffold_414, whole genome shotgun sequence n=1 Tax=Sphaerobolus stellatus (strain SS14) TaxID=990650 RepID=A0A0C9TRE8_SPHS4|nr:hypothetical protein M422DRAFT_274772 [Sphaerobolus stellatus SS14]